MKDILQQQRADGFPDLAGSEVTIRLPIREAVLDEILRATVMRKGSVGPITRLAIKLQSNNRLSIPVELSQWPLPKSGEINCILGPSIDFQKDPRLLIMLAPSGWIGLLIRLFLGSVSALQGLVERSGDNLFIDLKTILARVGAAEYLPYIHTIGLRTDFGILVLELHLRIHEEPT